ncbi:MAG: DUF2905 domain-containing protein [SAR86 cluster bacterium]|nr:DUF2905 domain-containing protein [SAR86 cluster bacterium]
MQRFFIILGIVFLTIGIFYSTLQKLPLGKLPGDIVISGENFSFVFPIVTCIVISILLTILFKIFR